MRLSEQTVSLLKNFASINQNLQFKEGNKLSTISAQKNILVNAEIPETLPSDFAIYDLNKFLGVMSLFQDPELEIGTTSMTIGGKANYVFADPTMIVVPPEKDLAFPEPDVSFTMRILDPTNDETVYSSVDVLLLSSSIALASSTCSSRKYHISDGGTVSSIS